jgi:uncharacterized DUF497 family protein
MEYSYRWNNEKNELLLKERGLSFEMVLFALNNGGLLADTAHPVQARYPNKRMLQVNVDGYACAVPFIENGNVRFLKTIYRSRKVNRLHSGE